MIPELFASAAGVLFIVAFAYAVAPTLRQIGVMRGGQSLRKEAADTACSGRVIIKISIAFFITRLAIYLYAYLLCDASGAAQNGFFGSMAQIWTKSDAPHYLGLAKNGYVTIGDPRFHIVFFPLYPMLTAMAETILGDYFVSGIVVSNICMLVCCIYLYKLALGEGLDTKASFRAVLLVLVAPAAFFQLGPFSESLFLMLCVLCLYFMRQKRFVIAGLYGMLAAFTRSLGVLLAVPLILECLSQGLPEGIRSMRVRLLIRRVWPAMLVPLGTFFYLLVNRIVTGNWLQFLIYQKEHWNQSFGNFINTVHYLSAHAMQWDAATSWVLGWPQILSIFIALIIILVGIRRIRPVLSAYSLTYFFVAIAPTWLLSAPRYLMCDVPAYLTLAKLTRRKWAFALLVGLSCFALLYLCGAFVLGYKVY
ncbi:MAG: mannosyltransferase family protein [Christensenellales bacterium]